MSKYVAVLVVHRPSSLVGWHFGSTMQTFRSPVEVDKDKVKNWLKEKLACYPDAKINVPRNEAYTTVNYCIIHFEETEGVNVEEMLDTLIN